MVKKVIISLLFLMFILPMVIAASPFESSEGGGLQFAPIGIETFAVGEDYNAHIHVINDTSIQTSATTSCIMHLYSPSGSHTLEETMGWDSNNIEFNQLVTGGNQTLGQHSYIIYCNNTNLQNHIVKGSYQVTVSGNPDAGDNFKLGFSVLIIVLTGSIVVILIRSIGHMIDLDYDLMDLGTTWGMYLGLFAAYIIAREYISTNIINEMLLLYIQILAVPMIIVPMVALIFSIFVQGKRRNKEESYNFFRLQPPR